MSKTFISPRLYNAKGDIKKQWFVYYSYRNPESGKMQRFKVFDNLNTYRTKKGRLQRARVIIDSINELIAEGWNPFSNVLIQEQDRVEVAIKKAVQAKKLRVRARSQEAYRSNAGIFLNWAKKMGYHEFEITAFTKKHAEEYLTYLKVERQIGNFTHNKYKDFIKALFNEALKDIEDAKNPFSGFKNLPIETRKQNVAFTNNEAQRLVTYMKHHDPSMLFFIQHIYYCGLRPKEICHMKVGNFDFERKKILIKGKDAKNAKTAYIDMPEAFYNILRARGIPSLPSNYYLFVRDGEDYVPGPADKPTHRNRFSERFKRIKDKLEIPSDRTLYSWKHYAAIKAFEAGVSVLEIMRQFRHASLDQSYAYLKDLGCHIETGYAAKIPEL